MINIRVPEEETQLSPRILVIGVGGGGSNAVNNMIESDLQGVEYLVCNTDAQALKHNLADRKIQLGVNITKGLGGGAMPDVGRAAAEESLDEIMSYLDGANMVFVTAGMGGATGSGAAPVIARAAREMGILTVGVVTKPFHFEGAHRMRTADAAIEELQQYVDTLLIIPNQNLFRIANEKTTFADAFKMADNVLHSGVRGVTDLIVMPGLINLDFADIRSVMAEMGKAMMGTGEAEGERRSVEAAEAAISNPLLEDISMKGARGVLINITGGMDMTLFEVDEACNRIRDEVDPDANIIFGSTFNPELEGKIRVSVVATGIDAMAQAHRPTGYVAPTPAYSAPKAQPQPQTAAVQKTAPVSQSFVSASAPAKTEAVAKSMFGSNNVASPQPAQAEASNSFFSSGSVAHKVDTQPSPQSSFIPPAPEKVEAAPAFSIQQPLKEPEQADLEEAIERVEEKEGQQTIQQQQESSTPLTPPTSQAGSLNLSAAEPSAQPARKASLFDRLTGRTKPDEKEAAPQQQSIQSATVTEQSGLKIHTNERALSSNLDDDLDIPAFLRRQAN